MESNFPNHHDADFKQSNPQTRELETLTSRYHGERLKGANDPVVSNEGVIFFTDKGMVGPHGQTGRVYRFHSDGKLDYMLMNGPSSTALCSAVTGQHCLWL